MSLQMTPYVSAEHPQVREVSVPGYTPWPNQLFGACQVTLLLLPAQTFASNACLPYFSLLNKSVGKLRPNKQQRSKSFVLVSFVEIAAAAAASDLV